jgi:hypothetical protein
VNGERRPAALGVTSRIENDNDDESESDWVFPGHPKRTETATRSSKPAIFADQIAHGVSRFEAAPSESLLLRLVARVMLHTIVSRGSERFRGFLDRFTHTSCGSVYGHLNNKFYGANGIQDELPHEFKSYQVWQRERVSSQPGLTGFWQVNGKNRTTFTEMIKSRLFSLAGNKSIMSGMPRRTARYWSTPQKDETSILKGIFTLAPDLHANRDFVASGYHSCGEHR